MKSKTFKIFLITVAVLSVFSCVYLYQFRKQSGSPIRSDGWGYYSYLPAVFDYQDLTFQFWNEEFKPGIRLYENGNYINKYPIGVAIMQFPLFLAADIGCKIFSPDMATGYSSPYQISVIVSTVIYGLMGLILLYKYLKTYFSEKIVMWTLASIVFATNFFHYMTFDACFSHIYSFFLITAFIYLIENKKETYNKDLLVGVLAGMIFVARNPNIVIIFFYLLWKVYDKASFIKRMKEIFIPKKIGFNILGASIPVSIQCAYWYYATGKFVIRSYDKGETFSWICPHLVNVLFSVSKGMIFYAPILGIALCGIWILKYRKKDLSYLGILCVLILDIYITSAWDCWWYGGSLGQRPFIDFYAVFALLLASVLDFLDGVLLSGDYIKITGKTISFFDIIMKPLLVMMIMISAKFMLAYWHGILPFSDATMTEVMNVLNWNFDEMRAIIVNNIYFLNL